MSDQQSAFYPSYPYYYYPQPPQAYYPTYDTRASNNQSGQNQQIPMTPNPNSTTPSNMSMSPSETQGGNAQNQGMLPTEQSYIENILRMNKGKEATVYMTFEGGSDGGKRQVFKGKIEAAGRDHIILSDPDTGKRYLLLMVYLDYVTFDEPINYSYPYGGNQTQMATYPSR